MRFVSTALVMMTIALMLLALMLLSPTVRANPSLAPTLVIVKTVNEWPVPTGHRVQRAYHERVTACNAQRGTRVQRLSMKALRARV